MQVVVVLFETVLFICIAINVHPPIQMLMIVFTITVLRFDTGNPDNRLPTQPRSDHVAARTALKSPETGAASLVRIVPDEDDTATASCQLPLAGLLVAVSS